MKSGCEKHNRNSGSDTPKHTSTDSLQPSTVQKRRGVALRATEHKAVQQLNKTEQAVNFPNTLVQDQRPERPPLGYVAFYTTSGISLYIFEGT